MQFELAGKTAMVAGASKGLGRAVARALAEEGVNVSMASRDAAAIQAAAADIGQYAEHRPLAATADVRVAADIERWAGATVERFGGIDLLFTNSGGPAPLGFQDLDDAAWRDAFELLVLSAIRLIRVAAPSMRSRGGGSIVLSSSSTAKEPQRMLPLSNVMRAGVASLAKTLSCEMAADNIRVNHLIPGRFDTDRVRYLDEAKANSTGIPVASQRAASIAAIPMQRYGEPHEYARAAVFLLSASASYITGATLQVDGGLLRGLF